MVICHSGARCRLAYGPWPSWCHCHLLSLASIKSRFVLPFAPCGLEHCRISPPRFLAECCKKPLNQGSFVLLYFRLFTFLICIEFVYLYFPVLFCLSVSVKWLAVKTASEMTYIVSSGALNSTSTNQGFAFLVPAHRGTPGQRAVKQVCVCVCVCVWKVNYCNRAETGIGCLWWNSAHKN